MSLNNSACRQVFQVSDDKEKPWTEDQKKYKKRSVKGCMEKGKRAGEFLGMILRKCKLHDDPERNHPQLIFNGTAVVNVSEHKHLGLILKPGLSFEKHLSEKISKAKQNVGILKHLSKFLHLTICIKPLFVLILITAMSLITYHL